MSRFSRNVSWKVLVAVVGATFGAYAQHPGHSAHPLMHGQKLYLHVQLMDGGLVASDRGMSTGAGLTLDVPLKMVTSEAPQSLDQAIPLPAPRKSIIVRRYLPKAVLEQEVGPDESGKGPPAVEVSIVGPKQSFRRWLAANDPERNRLSSYIGTWRFMAVKSKAERDALWRQFETEFTRVPEIVVRGSKGSVEQRIPAEVGRTYELDNPPGKLTVKKFHPDCGMDRSTGEAKNQSERRRNPAVLIEIEGAGTQESRWVFAKFPGFAPAQGHVLPYQVTLDCAIEPAEGLPDFAIVAVGDGTELWTRSNGATKAGTIAAGEKVPVPGSSYQFEIGRIVSSARLTEFYKKDEKGKAALEVEYVGSDAEPGKVWVELGHSRSVNSADGAIMVSFQMRDESAKGRLGGGGHP